jgi:hypothetical protein
MYENLKTYFADLRENIYIKKVLGSILSLGNYLNAGDANKERADGFLLKDTLSLVYSKKDNNKDPVLY